MFGGQVCISASLFGCVSLMERNELVRPFGLTAVLSILSVFQQSLHDCANDIYRLIAVLEEFPGQNCFVGFPRTPRTYCGMEVVNKNFFLSTVQLCCEPTVVSLRPLETQSQNTVPVMNIFLPKCNSPALPNRWNFGSNSSPFIFNPLECV